MRHTDGIISIGGKDYPVAATVLQEVKTLLKKAGSRPLRDDRDWVPVEEVFPELDDPVMGPAIYLRGIRRREQMTQKELAKKVGMLQHHISEMERGKRPISKAVAKKLAAVLNTHWKGFF